MQFYGGGVSAQELTTTGELIVMVDDYEKISTIQLYVEQVSNLAWDSDENNVYQHDLLDFSTSGWSSRKVTPDETHNWITLDMAHSPDANNPPLYLARYKIVVYEIIDNWKQPMDSLYIDYRTSDLPEAVLIPYGGSGQPDIYFRYNDKDNELTYNDGSPGPIDENYWDLKSSDVSNIKEDLEPLSPENFDIPNKNHWESNPQLVWDHGITSEYRTGYAVYRKEAASSYQKIATLSKNTTSYTDQNTVISEAGQNIRYYIKTINGIRESDPSPSIGIIGIFNKSGINNNNLTFNLSQNYPNPFNPTTTISYSIPSDEHVTLKIYDSLGEEIAMLVNEFKSAGFYNTNFNAENLSSGIYIYKITAGKYTDTKKLLLVK